jgi:hypothetical protein
MADVSADTRDLHRFAAQVAGAGRRAAIGGRAALEASTAVLRADMRAAAAAGQRRSPSRIRGFPASITSTITGLESETGPEKRGIGNLGALLYAGGATGGGVIEDPTASMTRTAPAFLEALGKVGEESALGGSGAPGTR